MEGLHIAVMGARRPRHLRVCLDSVFRMKGIQYSPVHVYIDGADQERVEEPLYNQFVEYCECFPIADLVFHPKSLGILDSHIEALRMTFANPACNYVLYLEDDLLIRSDALTYLERARNAHDAFFYVLYRSNHQFLPKEKIERDDEEIVLIPGGYTPLGVMVDRESFEILDREIRLKHYEELDWPGHPEHIKFNDIPDAGRQTHDAIFKAISLKHRCVQLVPPRCYTAHFGTSKTFNVQIIDGAIITDPITPTRAKLEQEFFRGPEEQWLDNLAAVFRSDRLRHLEYAYVLPYYFDYR